jgi:hypothetical protein
MTVTAAIAPATRKKPAPGWQGGGINTMDSATFRVTICKMDDFGDNDLMPARTAAVS